MAQSSSASRRIAEPPDTRPAPGDPQRSAVGYKRAMGSRRIRGDFERRVGQVIPVVVRDTRRALGWSQDELAARSGTPQPKISRLESGALDRVTLAEASHLIDVLG